MNYDIRTITDNIIEWRETILPDAHPTMMLDKLIEELEELKAKPCDGHEMADIMIIFLDYCHTVGVDIVKAVHYKMEINRERTWEIDKDGKLQHKRFDESDLRDPLAYCGHCEEPVSGGTSVECLHDVGAPCLIDGVRRPNRIGD
jgi:hypothetical protein